MSGSAWSGVMPISAAVRAIRKTTEQKVRVVSGRPGKRREFTKLVPVDLRRYGA